MSPLDNLLDRFPVPTWRPLAWFVVAIMLACFTWAAKANLEEIVTANGVVVPQSQVKVVQHLEGGIITAIHVREGDQVEAGQPLLQLDLGSGGTNAEELQVRLDALALKRARLKAQRDGTDFSLPSPESARQPHIAAAESATYDSQRQQFDSELKVIRKQISQQEFEVAAIFERRQSVQRRLELAREQLGMIKQLYDSEIMPRMKLLDLEREVELINGELLRLEVEYNQAGEALLEAQEREQQQIAAFRSQAASELNQVELELSRNREILTEANAQKERSEIVSPINGVVKRSRFNTIGGIVKPGDSIMEIVPSEDVLVVEARLSPIDVGHVAEGQPALVKVSTFDYLRYGGLQGTVAQVSADSSADQSGQQYFKVIVQTSSNRLGNGAGDHEITPGMEAMVDVKIGTRSVLSYLIKPVLKLKNEAFRER